MLFDFTMKSFRILLNAVPRWMLPLAYGGPSCKTNMGLPLRAWRIRPYRSSDSHRSSILGSAVGRFAFIGNPVFGKLTVFFRSTEETFMGLTFHRSGCEGPGTSASIMGEAAFGRYSQLNPEQCGRRGQAQSGVRPYSEAKAKLQRDVDPVILRVDCRCRANCIAVQRCGNELAGCSDVKIVVAIQEIAYVCHAVGAPATPRCAAIAVVRIVIARRHGFGIVQVCAAASGRQLNARERRRYDQSPPKRNHIFAVAASHVA